MLQSISLVFAHFLSYFSWIFGKNFQTKKFNFKLVWGTPAPHTADVCACVHLRIEIGIKNSQNSFFFFGLTKCKIFDNFYELDRRNENYKIVSGKKTHFFEIFEFHSSKFFCIHKICLRFRIWHQICCISSLKSENRTLKVRKLSRKKKIFFIKNHQKKLSRAVFFHRDFRNQNEKLVQKVFLSFYDEKKFFHRIFRPSKSENAHFEARWGAPDKF